MCHIEMNNFAILNESPQPSTTEKPESQELTTENFESQGETRLSDLLRISQIYDIPADDLTDLLNEDDEDSDQVEPLPIQCEAAAAVASATVSHAPLETAEEEKPAAAIQPQLTVSFPVDKVRQNCFYFVVSRGGMVLEQPGNLRLRRIIETYAEQYVHARRHDRGLLKQQVFGLLDQQFEFVIQKQAFMRFYERDINRAGGRQLSRVRMDSILQANGGVGPIQRCPDSDFIRVGDDCALDVVGHLLRDAANEIRRKQRLQGMK